MNASEHPSHAILGFFSAIQDPTRMVYMRIETYDPETGNLRTSEENGRGGDDWIFDGERWVCVSSYTDEPGDITLDMLDPASVCASCGDCFDASDAEENYCGCRH